MWVSMDQFDATTICADSVSKAVRAPYNSTGNTGTTGQRQFRQCERLYHTNCVNWRELCAKKNKKLINDSLMRYKQWIYCIIYVSYLYNRLQIKYHHSMTPQCIIYQFFYVIMTYLVFQKSPKVSEVKKPTITMSIMACESSPKRDWCSCEAFTMASLGPRILPVWS